jgi:hypothetical protein
VAELADTNSREANGRVTAHLFFIKMAKNRLINYDEATFVTRWIKNLAIKVY